MDFYTLTYLYTAGFMDLWFEGNIKELWLNFSKEVFYSFDVSYSYRWGDNWEEHSQGLLTFTNNFSFKMC